MHLLHRFPFRLRCDHLPARLRGLSLLALLLLAAAVVTAQDDLDNDQFSDDVFELDPFVVTDDTTEGWVANTALSAARLQQSLDKTPRSITVTTSELMEDTATYDLLDALEYTASISSQADFGANLQEGAQTQLNIRGVAAGVTFRNFYRHFGQIWGVNLDRIEVIKGPASALYGISSPGGQVNLVTKKPLFTNRGFIEVGVGSFGLRRAIVDGQVVALDERLGVRVVGAWEEDGIHFEDTPFERKLFHLPISFRITEDMRLNFEYEQQYRDGTPFKAQLAYPARNDDGMWQMQWFEDWDHNTRDPAVEFFDEESYVLNLEFTWEIFDFLDFNINASKGDADSYKLVTDDNETFFGDQSHPDLPNPGDYRLRGWERENELTTEGLTAMLAAEFDPFSWLNTRVMVGGYMYEDGFVSSRWDSANSGDAFDGRDIARFIPISGLGDVTGNRWPDNSTQMFRRFPDLFQTNGDIANFFTNNIYNKRSIDWLLLKDPETGRFTYGGGSGSNTKLENEAYWGTLTVSLFDDRAIFVGGWRKDIITQFDNPEAPGVENEATSPMASGLIEIIDGVSVFANYSESFVDEFSGLNEGEQPEPVTGKGWDVGFKFNTLSNRLTGYASVFSITREDATENEPVSGRNIQQIEENYDGWEVELIYALANHWQIITSYYEVDRDRLWPNVQVIDDESKFAFLTKYEFTEGQFQDVSVLFGATWVADRTEPTPFNPRNGEPYWTGEFLDRTPGSLAVAQGRVRELEDFTIGEAQFHDFDGPLPAERPSYWTVRVGASYEFERWGYDWRAQLNIDNIFHEKYKIGGNWQAGRHFTFSLRMSL